MMLMYKVHVIFIINWIVTFLLSQPNNNHNPNNKTTITVVGLRLSNLWEYHDPPTSTQTQNYMIEQK